MSMLVVKLITPAPNLGTQAIVDEICMPSGKTPLDRAH